ncbi:MAG: sodium:proton antiporter, partial [Alphaproteobacteria bacterium]|nr:sodium:proton antiporter [Alphaproteobacteria bacterium]
MTIFEIIASLLTAVALVGYINQRWLKLPTTIALMGFALLLSIIGISLGRLGIINLGEISAVLKSINFSDVLLDGMLSLLLFAGALQIDLSELRRVHSPVIALATLGVVISTVITGGLTWAVAHALGFDLPLVYAMMFGAIISPTDPIAVLAILKKARISKRLYAGIGGESLFNDGVSVVIFVTLLGVITKTQEFEIRSMAVDLVWKIAGGIGFGAMVGMFTSYLLRTIDEYKVEILLTLALASGGYVLAGILGLSGPVAVAISGLVIGSRGRQPTAIVVTQRHLYLFWELLDEVLNAILFMLIGLELVVITITGQHFIMGLLAIPILLFARFVSVGLPIAMTRMFHPMERGTIRLLTWGGLRGGISIAMALSLPSGLEKELILAMIYIIVVFSILVQG